MSDLIEPLRLTIPDTQLDESANDCGTPAGRSLRP